MSHYSINVTIKDIDIPKKWQNKLKKIKEELETTFYESQFEDKTEYHEKVELWYERDVLKQNLDIYFRDPTWIDVTCDRIDMDNLKTLERIFGYKLREITIQDNKNLRMIFSKGYKDNTYPQRRKANNKDEIAMLPQIQDYQKVLAGRY